MKLCDNKYQEKCTHPYSILCKCSLCDVPRIVTDDKISLIMFLVLCTLNINITEIMTRGETREIIEFTCQDQIILA